jgi:hypothetical protein
MPDFRAGANCAGEMKGKRGKRVLVPPARLEEIRAAARRGRDSQIKTLEGFWGPPLTPEAGRAAFRHRACGAMKADLLGNAMKGDAGWGKPSIAEAIIAAADRGDVDSQMVADEATLWLMEHHSGTPKLSVEYLAKRPRGTQPRGRRGHGNELRDLVIRDVFTGVCAMGVQPTRAREAKAKKARAPSAASITTELMAEIGVHVTEDLVERICRHIEPQSAISISFGD